MYRSLAFPEEDGTHANQAPIFSVETIKDSQIETFRGHKTSRRTLLVCSLILIATSGLLATWLFVARPHFYPNLGVFGRSTDNEDFELHVMDKSKSLESRKRRSIELIESRLKVEVLTSSRHYPVKESRLPFDLIPEEYFLHLDVDLNSDSFKGKTKIKLACEKRTNKVVFHGRRIVLNNLTVYFEKDMLKFTRIVYIRSYELFVVEMEADLMEGNVYDINIDYTAMYGKSLAGFYKSNYTNNGVQRSMVSTHFEPTDARSAFPCLDEPFFKAYFHISITHRNELIALSNMPRAKQKELDENRVYDEFEKSVRMSTYLVAFSVNDFSYREKKTPDGLPVRVYARKDDYNRISYAVDAATKIIAFYEKYFNVTYPLPKLDLLSVPDFMAGAMEDWGLVSFRSAYLIFDENIMTVESQRQITLVIAHELAHQWFGNLVTMEWWNDIWLNEGFANFVEMHGTNTVDQQFNALDMQVPTGWQAAIALDSLWNSHPVSQHVQRNSEIDELFDAISYNKGASLLRMVQGFMRDDFIKGVKTYLEQYKYANAKTNDLWRHLTQATSNSIDIKEVMETWTKQRSFPVITLSRNGSENRFTATQESFLTMSDSNNSAAKDNSNLWQVPLSFITAEDQQPKTLFLKERETLLPIDNDVPWVKLNIHSMGFYVANYDTKTWNELSKQLMDNYRIFTDVDRAGLLHDAFKLACENLIDPTITLEMTKYLKKEYDFIPWAMVRARSECMSMMLPNKNDKLKYKKYIWALQSHLINIDMLRYGEDIPKPKLTKFQRLQRFEAFSFALKHHFGNRYREEISRIFSDMVQGKAMVNLMPEVRALALMYGYNATNETHWNYLWQIYSMSEVDADRKIVMRAFAQFKDLDKINLILSTTLDTKKMRLQDTIPMLSNLVKFGSRKLVWDFVKKNINTFRDRYGGGYQLGQLLVEVAGGFNTKDMLKEVKIFLKKHPIGATGSRTELQVLEKIKNNINRHSDCDVNRKIITKIKNFLEEESKKRDHVS